MGIHRYRRRTLSPERQKLAKEGKTIHMLTVYKLTDRDGYTQRDTPYALKWGEWVTHEASSPGTELCTSQVIHYYGSPELALLLNPIHAGITEPLVWEAEISKSVAHDGLKGGAKRLTTIQQVTIAAPTTAQRVRFAILCSLELPQVPGYCAWTRHWLDGTNRTEVAAEAVAAAVATAVTRAVARKDMIEAVSAGAAAGAAEAAAAPIKAAVAAAAAVGWAAEAAAEMRKGIDFHALAHRAYQEEPA